MDIVNKMDLLAKERKETKEVSGFGLAFWAIGRAIRRFFRGIFGGGDDDTGAIPAGSTCPKRTWMTVL